MTAKPRKTPGRTCVGCGESGDKRAFVRFVRTPEGDVTVDPTGKANGRGAYTHADQACFETALKKRKFNSSLRTDLTEYDVERLRREFEQTLLGHDAPRGR